jgi:predicted transcriptional regulator
MKVIHTFPRTEPIVWQFLPLLKSKPQLFDALETLLSIIEKGEVQYIELIETLTSCISHKKEDLLNLFTCIEPFLKISNEEEPNAKRIKKKAGRYVKTIISQDVKMQQALVTLICIQHILVR